MQSLIDGDTSHARDSKNKRLGDTKIPGNEIDRSRDYRQGCNESGRRKRDIERKSPESDDYRKAYQTKDERVQAHEVFYRL
jgi:hypothetical protein